MSPRHAKRRVGILLIQQLDQRIHIQTAESAIARQRRGVVPDEQVVVEQPDVGLDAGAAVVDGLEQRDPAPVVVVRVAADWDDVAGRVGRVVGDVCACLAWLAPVRQEVVVRVVVPEEAGAGEDYLEDVQDAAGECLSVMTREVSWL